MARSGGTIISRCLGCMKDLVVLSEIHPLGSDRFNPVDQAHHWFRLLTLADIRDLREREHISFLDAIKLIADRCAAAKKILVVRDWNHLDFTGVPFLNAPTYRLLTAEILGESFSIVHVATVRHPIDQWLSLRQLERMEGKLTLSVFLNGYRRFAEHCCLSGFIRYEDFVRSPERVMKRLCHQLQVPYDPAFIRNWAAYHTFTGDIDSERGCPKEIRLVPRRPMEAGLADDFKRNPDYIRSIDILGYRHPL